jgi:ATP/maltotriose-dependent transcriptional regulator MalT
MYREALPIYREVYGPEHPEVASVISNLGRTALMTGRIDEAEPLLRQALSMSEKFEGDTHDDLISPLNSLAMIDAYRGRLEAARSEIQRAVTIARMPNHDGMLDQVLLTEADLELAAGNRALAASLLNEAQAQLRRLHPNQSADAWRYAVWNSVNAQRLAGDGDQAGAAQALAAAQRILDQRFGANGFYSLLAKRRQQLIATYAK